MPRKGWSILKALGVLQYQKPGFAGDKVFSLLMFSLGYRDEHAPPGEVLRCIIRVGGASRFLLLHSFVVR